jgi:regulator of protease activity HflC (stomatin/prohibitin superfamily)
MGLGSWLLDLGVSVETTVGKVATRTGHAPLQWPAGQDGDSLIHRLPRDPHQRASMFSKNQGIVVSQGESAVVLEDGKPFGVLDPGVYHFERARLIGVLDVIWIKSGQRAMKWGVGNITSVDGIQINANGVMYLRVEEGIPFVSEIVQGNLLFTELDLQRFLMPRVQSVLRSIVAQMPALSLQAQRDTFTNSIRQNLSETLRSMGLAAVDFEVVELNFPPEFKAVIAQAAMMQHSGQADLIRAQADAQIAQVKAAGEAGAQLTTGLANLQLLAAMQQQGLDPLRMKAMEALQTFAETPSTGSFIGGDAAKAQLFGQVAAAALSGSMGATIAPPQTSAAPPLSPTLALPSITESVSAADTSSVDIQRQIDGLTARLAEGRLSEEMYVRLVGTLEAKLRGLGGA